MKTVELMWAIAGLESAEHIGVTPEYVMDVLRAPSSLQIHDESAPSTTWIGGQPGERVLVIVAQWDFTDEVYWIVAVSNSLDGETRARDRQIPAGRTLIGRDDPDLSAYRGAFLVGGDDRVLVGAILDEDGYPFSTRTFT